MVLALEFQVTVLPRQMKILKQNEAKSRSVHQLQDHKLQKIT